MHISVLKEEVIDALNLKEDSIIVDMTLGYGGHSSSILRRIKKGHLFAFDQDIEAIEYSTNFLKQFGDNYTIIKTNFVNMKENLRERNIKEVDGILFDLGVSSPQLDEDIRGFSYHKDATLDMRMDKENTLDAYYIVNNYKEEQLAHIFFKYGEDKYSKIIAKNIVKERQNKKIETTLELVEIIKKSVPFSEKKKKHPAKQIFQALRIEVNHELEVLELALKDACSMLKVGGRVAVITFHSLEDRIVKNYFKTLTQIDEQVKGLPNIPDIYIPNFKLVYNKAITPTEEELKENNRSRSAKLRVIERIK